MPAEAPAPREGGSRRQEDLRLMDSTDLRSLGWRGWLRAMEIVTLALLFAAYVYLDALAAREPQKVRGRFRRALRWFARRLFAQEALRREERLRAQAAWLRHRLVKLGPTFIKIGQALATRADLLPLPYIQELARLQDDVPPFPQPEAARILREELGAPPEQLFAVIHWEPIASASLGQVYYGRLPSGDEVAIKVQRPRLREAIQLDLVILKRIARFLKRYPDLFRGVDWTGVLDEFAVMIFEEMNYRQEALHAERFRENFRRWKEVYVPKIYWAYTTERVLTMEYIHGVKVTDVEELRRRGFSPTRINRLLARTYLKQLLEDGFFHADMHPGNIFVSLEPATFGRYISLDFGIVGTLTEYDKEYLAQNFTAFFRRDYKRVAELHIESGWVPPQTRVDELEAAIRAVCEPYFDRPLKEISLGMVLMRLFQTSRRFNVEIQPQLVLLQKTLLNIEGLGRELDPDLDLWSTAKPFLEQWMAEQLGPRRLWREWRNQAPRYAKLLPELPRLLHDYLQQGARPHDRRELEALLAEQRRTNRLLQGLIYTVYGFLFGLIVTQLWLRYQLW